MNNIHHPPSYSKFPDTDTFESPQSKDGLYTIHYTKKDLDEIKDTKSFETLSKLDSSIERFVKLLNNNSENKDASSARDMHSNDQQSNDVEFRSCDGYCKVNASGFECLHCPEISVSLEEFKKHYKECHLKIYYDCQKCGFSTRCYGTMTDHISKYHDNDISLIKRKIFRVTGSNDNMPSQFNPIMKNSHRQKETLPPSLIDSSTFDYPDSKDLVIDSDVEKIEMEESEESEYEFRSNGNRHECRVCNQEFTRSERVREHYDAIHLNIVYACSLCGYTNRWKRSVIQHLRSKHKKSPPYKPLMIRKKVGNLSNQILPNSSGDEDRFVSMRLTKSLTIRNGKILNLSKPGQQLRSLLSVKDRESDESRRNKMLDNHVDQRSLLIPNNSHHNIPHLSNPLKDKFQAMHLRLVWVCRKCGFFHKWRVVMTNHLRAEHNLSPPFNQYMIRRKDDCVGALDLSRMQPEVRINANNADPKTPSNAKLKPCEPPNQSLLSDINNILKEVKDDKSNPTEQIYPCSLCGKSFESIRGLKEHNDGMHKNMVWACKLCPFTDKWRPQAISHLRSKHKCKPPYNDQLRRVPKLPLSLPRLQPKVQERNVKKKADNEIKCDPPLPLAAGIIRKFDESRSDSLKDCYIKINEDHYQCKFCFKLCSSAQGITEHFEAIHLNMLYHCQLCDFTDVWRSMMTKHLKHTHKVGRPYDIYLKRKKIDPETKKMHLENRIMNPFQMLPPITNNFSNGLSCNPSPLNLSSNFVKPEEESYGKQYIHVNNQLQCKVCWSIFTSLQGFQEHYEAIHLDIIWTCRNCSVSFRWRQQLTKHLKLVHKCEPPFNEHMLKETGSHKLKKRIPDKTPKINRPLTQLAPTLNPLLGAAHLSPMPMLLPKPIQSRISTPISNIFSDNSKEGHSERPISLKNYNYNSNQFSCKLCSAVFTSLQGFQEHYEAIHLNVVYACKICGFENRWRPQVTTHLKKCHQCEPPYGDYMIKRPSTGTSKSAMKMRISSIIEDGMLEELPGESTRMLNEEMPEEEFSDEARLRDLKIEKEESIEGISACGVKKEMHDHNHMKRMDFNMNNEREENAIRKLVAESENRVIKDIDHGTSPEVKKETNGVREIDPV